MYIRLKKLFHYGVRGLLHQLLKSYLSDRQQYSIVGGMKSDLSAILWEVPQGSVLGPLLFILFMNDLPKSSDMNSWLFADNTGLTRSSASFSDLQDQMNREVGKVKDWLLANKLSVHYAKKTQYILFIPPAKVKEKPANFTLSVGGSHYRANNYL